jgi:hypothetical protein
MLRRDIVLAEYLCYLSVQTLPRFEMETSRDHGLQASLAKPRYVCLVILIPLYTLLCALLMWINVRQTGTFVYALDDAYIHMALAKNLAAHGIFGLTQEGFTGCSSSPLWVFLVSTIYAVTGVQAWAPLVLNILFGLVLVYTACEILLRSGGSRLTVIFTVTALYVFVPLPVLPTSGMEHGLHVLLSILLMFWAATLIAEPKTQTWLQVTLPITIAAAVLVRFETLFLVAGIIFLLLVRRRLVQAAMVLVAALAPMGILGLYSVSKGWFWLPTSLLLKGRMPEISSMKSLVNAVGCTALLQLFTTPHLVTAVVALMAIYLWRSARGISVWDRGQVMICITFITMFLHLQYALTGGLGRYESYLLAMSVVSIGCADLPALFQPIRAKLVNNSNIVEWLPWSIASIVLLFPLFLHGLLTAVQYYGATRSLFRQQYQMSRFLATYYNDTSLAANDIGAVSFFTRIRCLDLYGLANSEICRLKRAGQFDTRAIDQLARAEDTKLAIVYDSWFRGKIYNGFLSPKLPASWRRVAEWKTQHAVFVADDTVSFYAVDPAEAPHLKQRLIEFADHLPNGDTQTLSAE